MSLTPSQLAQYVIIILALGAGALLGVEVLRNEPLNSNVVSFLWYALGVKTMTLGTGNATQSLMQGISKNNLTLSSTGDGNGSTATPINTTR